MLKKIGEKKLLDEKKMSFIPLFNTLKFPRVNTDDQIRLLFCQLDTTLHSILAPFTVPTINNPPSFIWDGMLRNFCVFLEL